MKIKLVYLEESRRRARRNGNIIKMVSFTRTLPKHITKTGTHYAALIMSYRSSPPREIAQDLQLEADGLCSIESG
jgi:hypothetical protein